MPDKLNTVSIDAPPSRAGGAASGLVFKLVLLTTAIWAIGRLTGPQRNGEPSHATLTAEATPAHPPGGRVQAGDLDLDGSGAIFTAKRLWTEIGKDRVLSVAGGLTFFGLLALFPAITALVSIFGLFADPAQISMDIGNFTALLPHDASAILIDQAKAISAASSTNLSLAAVVALVVALWSANGGTKALIEALNVAYGVTEERGFVCLNTISFGATICTIAIGMLLIAVVAVLPGVLAFFWLGPVTENLLLWGRWPAIFLLMMGFLAFAYRYAPNRRNAPWRWITPGAFFASTGLVAFSLLFNWYAQNLGNYNQTYGSLGAVVALMTWMWLSAALVLIGAELNAELDRQTMSANKKGPAAAPANVSR